MEINLKQIRRINLIGNILFYSFLILIVYWGTLLAIFSFWSFGKSFKLGPDYFQAVFGLIGLVSWLNFFHYYKRLKKYTVSQLARQFYKKEKKKIYLTAALTVIFVIVFKAAQAGFNLPAWAQNILHLSSLPWSFGDSVIFIVGLNVRRYIPALEIVNELGWLLSLTFEIIFFYYISRLVFWRPKLKKATAPGLD